MAEIVTLSEYMSWSHTTTVILMTIGFISSFLALLGNPRDLNSKISFLFSAVVVVMLVYRMGFHPIGYGLGSDRANYAMQFLTISAFGPIDLAGKNEIVFAWFNYLFSFIGGVKTFFVGTAIIYMVNYCVAIKNFVGQVNYWMLLSVVLSMAFVSYNVNTMRGGLALSFVVLGISMYPSKIWMPVFLLIASFIHTSAAIPSLIVVICYFFPNTSLFYKLWFLSIPVSFFAGNFFQELFAGMSDDSRTSYLEDTETTRYNVGFRIDFILYSLAPIVVGWYYIFRKKFKDNLYTLIYNTYVLTNIFWILVIRANYSDRFAYLSWFLIPFVLVYPLLKGNISLKVNVWIFFIILGESLFLFAI